MNFGHTHLAIQVVVTALNFIMKTGSHLKQRVDNFCNTPTMELYDKLKDRSVSIFKLWYFVLAHLTIHFFVTVFSSVSQAGQELFPHSGLHLEAILLLILFNCCY